MCITWPPRINSLAPGEIWMKFWISIFQANFGDWWLWDLFWNCPGWMSIYLSGDKSTLVQVMAWCRQAASHYLSQCCPRSLSPYGITRPQWIEMVKTYNLHMPELTSTLKKLVLWRKVGDHNIIEYCIRLKWNYFWYPSVLSIFSLDKIEEFCFQVI